MARIEYRIVPRNTQEKEWAELVGNTISKLLDSLNLKVSHHIEVVRKASWGGAEASDYNVYRHDGNHYRFWINIRNLNQKPTMEDLQFAVRGVLRGLVFWNLIEQNFPNPVITQDDVEEEYNNALMEWIDKEEQNGEKLTQARIDKAAEQYRIKKNMKIFEKRAYCKKLVECHFKELYGEDHTRFALIYG